MRALATFVVLIALANAASASDAHELPSRVRAFVSDARLQGSGVLRFLGVPVYDAYYWSPQRTYSPALPFALELRYWRDLEGRRIAQRSIDEIAALGYGSAEERERWTREMTRLFPDVRRGDRLIGVNVPQKGARFFYNDEPIGAIDDPAFTRAFFGIWFDRETSRPDLRRQLLGER